MRNPFILPLNAIILLVTAFLLFHRFSPDVQAEIPTVALRAGA